MACKITGTGERKFSSALVISSVLRSIPTVFNSWGKTTAAKECRAGSLLKSTMKSLMFIDFITGPSRKGLKKGPENSPASLRSSCSRCGVSCQCYGQAMSLHIHQRNPKKKEFHGSENIHRGLSLLIKTAFLSVFSCFFLTTGVLCKGSKHARMQGYVSHMNLIKTLKCLTKIWWYPLNVVWEIYSPGKNVIKMYFLLGSDKIAHNLMFIPLRCTEFYCLV